MRVRVNDRTQLNHDGQVYDGGAFVELPLDAARLAIAHGIVTEAPAKAAPKPAAKAKTPTANKGRR